MGTDDETREGRDDARQKGMGRVKVDVGKMLATGAVKKKAPVKKAAARATKKAARDEMPTGRPVGSTVGMAGVCKTSGCANQGVRQTFRVPALGRIALLPGGVMCLVCEKRMQMDLDDVVVERIEDARRDGEQ